VIRIVADVTKDHDDRKVVQYLSYVPSDVFAACRTYPVIYYWGQTRAMGAIIWIAGD
jgi:hypothetical protein